MDSIFVRGREYRNVLDVVDPSAIKKEIESMVHDPDYIGNYIAEEFAKSMRQVEPNIDPTNRIPRYIKVTDVRDLVRKDPEGMAMLASSFWQNLFNTGPLSTIFDELRKSYKKDYAQSLKDLYDIDITHQVNKKSKTSNNGPPSEELHVNPSNNKIPADNLPDEMWVNILSANPKLSVVDVLHMSRVNRRFNYLNRQGHIWDEIFRKQFGEETFKQAQKELSGLWWKVRFGDRPGLASLMALLVWRIYTVKKDPPTGIVYWKLFSPTDDNYIRHVRTRGLTHSISMQYLMPPTTFVNEFTSLLQPFPRRESNYLGVDQTWWLVTSQNQRHEGSFTPELERKLIYLLLAAGFRTERRDEYVGNCMHCGGDAKVRERLAPTRVFCGQPCQLKFYGK